MRGRFLLSDAQFVLAQEHGSNVVEVVISALRRKLGDNAGSLQTVRGAGYRFTGLP